MPLCDELIPGGFGGTSTLSLREIEFVLNSDPCAVMLVWWNQRIGIPKKKKKIDEKAGWVGGAFLFGGRGRRLPNVDGTFFHLFQNVG